MLEALSHAIGALESQIRAQPVPEADRMTKRYRQEAATLHRLLECDIALAGRAELLRRTLDDEDGAGIIAKAGDIQAGLRAIEGALRDRQAVLLV
jgi:hypothetical protein